MGFLDEVRAQEVKLGAPSRWDDLVRGKKLDDTEIEELKAALADHDVKALWIHRALKERGIKISDSTVKHWAQAVRTGGRPPWEPDGPR